jgi:hypothetical protein
MALMQILDVFPKELHIQIELSDTELNLLLDFLDGCEYEIDEESDKSALAHAFVTDHFFPMLDRLTQEIKAGRHVS